MVGESYKLTRPTLAIMILPDGKSIPIDLPQGTVVKVIADPVDGTRFIDVERSGQIVRMFAVDLKERGIPLV